MGQKIEYEHSFASQRKNFAIFIGFYHLLKTALAILTSLSPTFSSEVSECDIKYI